VAAFDVGVEDSGVAVVAVVPVILVGWRRTVWRLTGRAGRLRRGQRSMVLR
jgi:hypothetical protein